MKNVRNDRSTLEQRHCTEDWEESLTAGLEETDLRFLPA
jgi:hypothetical protein